MGLLLLLLAAAAINIAIAAAIIVRQLRRPSGRRAAWAIARAKPLHPGILGLTFRDVTIPLCDNTQTPAWIIDGQRTNGPNIIVTHGWGESRYVSLDRWTAHLATLARTIILYDLRAHGDSDGGVSHGGAREAQDLANIVHTLANPTDDAKPAIDPAAPLILYGFSMGAVATLRAAIQLANTRQPNHDQPPTPRITAVILEGIYRHWRIPMRNRIIKSWTPGEPIGSVAAALAWLLFPSLRNFDTARRAADLRLPALLLHAQDDPRCPLAQARDIAAAAPDAQLAICPVGEHGAIASLAPDWYVDTLTRFLDRVCPPPTLPDPE